MTKVVDITVQIALQYKKIEALCLFPGFFINGLAVMNVLMPFFLYIYLLSCESVKYFILYALG